MMLMISDVVCLCVLFLNVFIFLLHKMFHVNVLCVCIGVCVSLFFFFPQSNLLFFSTVGVGLRDLHTPGPLLHSVGPEAEKASHPCEGR